MRSIQLELVQALKKTKQKDLTMKKLNILIATFSLISSTSFATSLAPKVMMAELDGYNQNGAFELKVDNYGNLEFNNIKLHTVSKSSLSYADFLEISNLTRQLANAQVKTTHSNMVCMMMIASGASSDLKVSSIEGRYFSGRLHLALSEEGCWLNHHTQPLNQDTYVAARKIKMLLDQISLDPIAVRN